MKNSKKYLFLVLSVVVLIGICMTPAINRVIDEKKYAKAVEYAYNGEIDEAIEIFSEQQEKKNNEIVSFCSSYLNELCDSKSFELAWDWYFAVSYADLVPEKEVSHMYDQIQYSQAADLVASGEYIKAYEKYQWIGDEEKAEEVLSEHKNVFYDRAVSYYNRGSKSNLELAQKEFRKLGDYKESQEYLAQTDFMLSVCGTYQTSTQGRVILDIGILTSYDIGSEKKYTHTLTLHEYKGELCLFADYKNSMGAIYVLRNGEVYWHLVDVYSGGEFRIYTTEYITSAFTHIKKLSNSTEMPRKPQIGMTKSEVENSLWGEPKKINKSTYSWGTREQWVYSLSRYVYFENGIVTSIQE